MVYLTTYYLCYCCERWMIYLPLLDHKEFVVNYFSLLHVGYTFYRVSTGWEKSGICREFCLSGKCSGIFVRLDVSHENSVIIGKIQMIS